MIHKLKIEKIYLQRLIEKTKKAVILVNDRDYQPGDKLEVYNSMVGVPPGDLGHHEYFEITHVHSSPGMAPGFVCLSLEYS